MKLAKLKKAAAAPFVAAWELGALKAVLVLIATGIPAVLFFNILFQEYFTPFGKVGRKACSIVFYVAPILYIILVAIVSPLFKTGPALNVFQNMLRFSILSLIFCWLVFVFRPQLFSSTMAEYHKGKTSAQQDWDKGDPRLLTIGLMMEEIDENGKPVIPRDEKTGLRIGSIGCFLTPESLAYVQGYNARMRSLVPAKKSSPTP